MDKPHEKNRALPLLAAIFALAVGLIAAVLWASEPWQRPLTMLHVADGIWLAVAIAGFGAGVVAWPLLGPRRWAWRAVGGIALCAFFLPTALYVRSSAAVKALLDHDEIWKIVDPGASRPDPPQTWLDVLKEFWREEILHFFEVAKTYPSRGGLEVIIPPDAYAHLLETCRRPTRRAFLYEILTDESRVKLATHHWHRLFPAVIGQDVSLSHRSEWLDWLDERTADKSVPAACRDAAAFWMALIVLTDAEAFAPWAERTLSHMLASEDPPVSTARLMWKRPSGDVWMRALDLLLATTPEETHAERTAPLARDSTLLRRAARQRVRGMQHHANAIMEEIHSLHHQNRYQAAAAVWLDLRRLADAFATGDDADEIDDLLASTLTDWLLEESGILSVFSERAAMMHDDALPHEEFIIPMSADARQRLHAKAHALLDEMDQSHPNKSAPYLEPLYQVLMTADYLTKDDRIAIHNRVAGLITRWIPYLVVNHKTAMIHSTAGMMDRIIHDLDDDVRETLRRPLLEWCVSHESSTRTSQRMWPVIVELDLACPSRLLTDVEHIGLLWRSNKSFPYKAEAVAAFLEILDAEEEPARMQYPFRELQMRFRYAKRRSSNWTAEDLRYHAYRHRMIGPEHLPQDWVEFVWSRGIETLQNIPPEREVWEPFLRTPASASRLMNAIHISGYHGYEALFEYLIKHPPTADVCKSILNHFLRSAESHDRAERITAFKILLRFSSWLGAEERSVFRERLHLFFDRDRPGLEDWVGLHTHNHPGEWIPWEDDALSAAFSWSSQIHHELVSLPSNPSDETAVFRHLYASGLNFEHSEWNTPEFHQIDLDVIAPTSVFSDPMPSPPFVATAWQRARDLHLRRPNLNFPTRPIFRPSGERVRLRDEIGRIDP